MAESLVSIRTDITFHSAVILLPSGKRRQIGCSGDREYCDNTIEGYLLTGGKLLYRLNCRAKPRKRQP